MGGGTGEKGYVTAALTDGEVRVGSEGRNLAGAGGSRREATASAAVAAASVASGLVSTAQAEAPARVKLEPVV